MTSTNIRDIHVRGQYGVQLLQAATGISRLGPNEEPRIVVNNGGGVIPEPVDKLNWFYNYPQRLVKTVPIIVDPNGTEKTPYWEKGAATIIFSDRGMEKIRQYLFYNPADASLKSPPYNVLHIRGHDKKMASLETYRKFLNFIEINYENSLYVIGDDPDFIEDILQSSSRPSVKPRPPATHPITSYTRSLTGLTIATDYHTLLRADRVFSAPSAFVLSTLLIDRYKKIAIIGQGNCDGPYANKNDFIFIEEFRKLPYEIPSQNLQIWGYFK
jgi:hypothetical protein